MVVYYQKNVWCHLKDLAVNQLLHNRSIEKADSKLVAAIREDLHYMRFIPKNSGMRPIYPIKKSGISKNEIFKIRLLLSSITKQFGDGLIGLSARRRTIGDFWHQYTMTLKESGSFDSHLYVIKVDVTDAYGSIDQDLLMKIIKKSASKFANSIYYRVFSHVNNKGKVSQKKQYILANNQGELSQTQTKSHLQETDEPVQLFPHKLIALIRKYISEQYISAGMKRTYRVTRGIAQGGALSAALCDVYYSALYHRHWRALVRPDDLAMHCVDDFVFFTTDKTTALEYLEKSSLGVAEFNCKINPKKTIHNVQDDEVPIRVPFCGITICSATKQILVSAAQVVACPPRYSMLLKASSKAGKFVSDKFLMVTLARLNSMVIHPSYTSPAGLLANVYRVGIMSGARLEALCLTLLVGASTKQFNGRFLGNAIRSSAKKIWRRIAQSWKKYEDCCPPVSKESVYLAFMGKLGMYNLFL